MMLKVIGNEGKFAKDKQRFFLSARKSFGNHGLIDYFIQRNRRINDKIVIKVCSESGKS